MLSNVCENFNVISCLMSEIWPFKFQIFMYDYAIIYLLHVCQGMNIYIFFCYRGNDFTYFDVKCRFLSSEVAKLYIYRPTLPKFELWASIVNSSFGLNIPFRPATPTILSAKKKNWTPTCTDTWDIANRNLATDRHTNTHTPTD